MLNRTPTRPNVDTETLAEEICRHLDRGHTDYRAFISFWDGKDLSMQPVVDLVKEKAAERVCATFENANSPNQFGFYRAAQQPEEVETQWHDSSSDLDEPIATGNMHHCRAFNIADLGIVVQR